MHSCHMLFFRLVVDSFYLVTPTSKRVVSMLSLDRCYIYLLGCGLFLLGDAQE